MADSHHQKATLTCLFWAALRCLCYDHRRQHLNFMFKSIRSGKGDRLASDLGILLQETSKRTLTLLINERYNSIHGNLLIFACNAKNYLFWDRSSGKKGRKVSARVTCGHCIHIMFHSAECCGGNGDCDGEIFPSNDDDGDGDDDDDDDDNEDDDDYDDDEDDDDDDNDDDYDIHSKVKNSADFTFLSQKICGKSA